MKKLLLSAFWAVIAANAMADDYKYLTIYNKDGKAIDIELSSLNKITFTATDMVAETTDGKQNFALSSLLKMAFSQVATPVDGINAATEGKLQYAAGALVVGPEAEGQTLAVYASNGAIVAQQTVGANGASINIAGLPKGVYVARIGKTAIKIAK